MTSPRARLLLLLGLLCLGGTAALAQAGDGAGGGLGAGFAERGLVLQLGLVLLAGLALNLTPCVYPVIPITVGFFLNQKKTSTLHSWLLAAVYVLGMSVTYSALGVTAALSGQLFGAAMQSPWVVGVIAVILLALASSMFGLWELRVPNWAGGLMGGKGFGGSFVMGLVVGVVAAPCIGPFVLGLLTYVGQKQSVTLGFLMFFTLSLGLGLPYLFLAAFSKSVEKLPQSGMWMVGVKQLFGVLLVAMAAHFVAPLLPPPSGDWLWSAVLVISGLYLLLVARPGHDQPWLDRFMRLASVALVVVGVVQAPALTSSQAGPEHVDWPPYEEVALQAALQQGRPVVIDFSADWCGPCKKLESKTFTDPRVAEKLSGMARFKADLTQVDDRTEALREKFEVAGVPTIMFFNRGAEIAETRLTGYEDPDQFLARLERVLR
ncbi:MAG: thioredoxin family protein [Acidobacteria bacterium]|nr:thioredoxin family protein [Acidobacteriota bacterium]